MSSFYSKLNSGYYEAYSLGKYVTVFVENESDIPFWYRILKKYAPQRTFRIFPSSKGHFERGKPHVLKLSDGAGKFMLLCVDSDYDYLLQQSTSLSKLINTHPYIFQTYAYSIENYKCFAESLEGLCVQASLNDEPLFDFIEFLHQYSSIVYELFLFSFYLRKIDETAAFTNTEVAAVCGVQGKVNISQNAKEVLEKLQKTVEEKLTVLKNSHPDIDLQAIAQELTPLGVTRENTYLFIHGHTVYQSLVLILLKRIIKTLQDHKRAEFKQYTSDNKQLLSQKQREYSNQIRDVETLLDTNTDYDSCFLMRHIQRDVESYLHASVLCNPNEL